MADYKRPNLTHLTQSTTVSLGKLKTKHNSVQFISQGKLAGAAACTDEYFKAILAIPELVQIAEMYFDSLGNNKGSLPYEIVKATLEKLRE